MSTPTRPQVVALVTVAALGLLWLVTGSFVLAVLVLVLVAGVGGLGWAVVSGRCGRARPRTPGRFPVEPPGGPATVVTTDLARHDGPGDRVRRALRLALARPWVRPEGLVRASTARVTSDDALVWMPRGERAGAPHLWVEWNAADAAEIGDRWPLDLLARELLEAHDAHVRASGTRRLQDRTWLHVLARDDVPLGRVVVTAAFSAPQDPVLVAVASPDRPAAPPGGPRWSGPRAPHPAARPTMMVGPGRR